MFDAEEVKELGVLASSTQKIAKLDHLLLKRTRDDLSDDGSGFLKVILFFILEHLGSAFESILGKAVVMSVLNLFTL